MIKSFYPLIANHARLSNLDDGLPGLSHIVNIFGLLLEFKDPNSTQSTFINVDDAKHMFNSAAAIFDIYTPLITIIHNVRTHLV